MFKQQFKKNKLEEVKSKGKIVLGVSPDYAPYEFLTTENGNKKVVGADIYLAEQIAKKLDVESRNSRDGI